MMIQNITILLEEDYASNNFCAYIPKYRLNAVGDTEEEALTYATELVLLQLNGTEPDIFSSKVVTIQVAVEAPGTITRNELLSTTI